MIRDEINAKKNLMKDKNQSQLLTIDKIRNNKFKSTL